MHLLYITIMKRNLQKRKPETHTTIRYYISDILRQQIKAMGVKAPQLSKASGIPISTTYHFLNDGTLKLSHICRLSSIPETCGMLQLQDIEIILNRLIHDAADESHYPQFSIQPLFDDKSEPPYGSLPDFLKHIRTNLLGLSVRKTAHLSERCSRNQIESIEKKQLNIGPSVLYRCFETYYQLLPEHTRSEYLTTFATLLMKHLLQSSHNYTFALETWKQKFR